MSDDPTLFDDPPPSRRKRATRYRIEFVDPNGIVMWDALVTGNPPTEFTMALHADGIGWRRPVVKGDPDRHLIFSHLDPVQSVEAAREFMLRRATKRGAVLELLLDRSGRWVSRDDIRRVGGDSGDRRVRELRQDGWPIEISQQSDKMAWQCRLDLPG